MMTIPAAEFQRHFGHYQDLALLEPVAITRNGRERHILLAKEEYLRLKRLDRQVMTLADFTEEDLQTLQQMEAPAEAAAFDHEMIG